MNKKKRAKEVFELVKNYNPINEGDAIQDAFLASLEAELIDKFDYARIDADDMFDEGNTNVQVNVKKGKHGVRMAFVIQFDKDNEGKLIALINNAATKEKPYRYNLQIQKDIRGLFTKINARLEASIQTKQNQAKVEA